MESSIDSFGVFLEGGGGGWASIASTSEPDGGALGNVVVEASGERDARAHARTHERDVRAHAHARARNVHTQTRASSKSAEPRGETRAEATPSWSRRESCCVTRRHAFLGVPR